MLSFVIFLFVMFCNFRFELRPGIFWYFLKLIFLKSDLFSKKKKKKKTPPPLWKCLNPPLMVVSNILIPNQPVLAFGLVC